MTGMTRFAQPMAMATTQLARVVHHENVLVEPKAELKSLRMSWVVVTDENGKPRLRMQWAAVEDC